MGIRRNIIFILLVLLSHLVTAQQVDFLIDTLSGDGCGSLDIELTDISTGTYIDRVWILAGDELATTDSIITLSFDSIGVYKIQLKRNNDTTNLIREENIQINRVPIAQIQLIEKEYINSFDKYFSSTAQLTESVRYIYTWDFGDPNNTEILLDTTFEDSSTVYHQYREEGTYTVFFSIEDMQHGCYDDTTLDVTVEDIFRVPNFFSPNGDGQNDIFKVTSNGIIEFSLNIYNRWGVEVYRSEPYTYIDWDGRSLDGTMVKPGLYYYVIEIEGETYKKNGFFYVFYGN